MQPTTMTMTSTPSHVAGPARRGRRAGAALTALAAAFLLFDAITKVLEVRPVVDAMADLGYPDVSRAVGLVLLACVLLHLVPRTAVLGAALLTAFLGGAVASQVRVEAPLLTHALFPVYVAALVWGGLYLRDARVRALAPWRA